MVTRYRRQCRTALNTTELEGNKLGILPVKVDHGSLLIAPTCIHSIGPYAQALPTQYQIRRELLPEKTSIGPCPSVFFLDDVRQEAICIDEEDTNGKGLVRIYNCGDWCANHHLHDTIVATSKVPRVEAVGRRLLAYIVLFILEEELHQY